MEIKVAMCSKIRAKENDLVGVFFLHRGRTRRENGIDTAHTIADLPTCFKNKVRLYHLGVESIVILRTPLRVFRVVGIVVN